MQVIERAAALASRHHPTAWGVAWVISAFLLTNAPLALAQSLVLDAQGNPHIAFQWPYGIKYAVRSGGSWHVETVAFEGWSPSLALGRRANDKAAEGAGPVVPHIAFQAAGIRYAGKKGHSWEVETVDPMGRTPSLAVDQGGVVHIAYALLPGLVSYATRQPSGVPGQNPRQKGPADNPAHDPPGMPGRLWSTELVGGFATSAPSLALDAEGRPGVAYSFRGADNEPGMRFAFRRGSAWDSETICHCDFAKIPVLAFDSHGNPRVAFTGDGVLMYVERNERGWSRRSGVQDEVRAVSMAVDAQDRTHLIYYGYHEGPIDPDGYVPEFLGLSYARRDAGSWVVEDVVPSPIGTWRPQSASIAVDGNGVPHISYYDRSNGDLKYARRLGPNRWETETVEVPRSEPSARGGDRAATAASDASPAAPDAVASPALDPIRPNPSAGPAHVRFSLPRRANVSLVIFDAQGRAIRILASGWLEAGRHDLLWNGTDDTGEEVGLGLYFARLIAEGQQGTQRIVWLR